ncbi:ATP synthase F0 subunit B [Desulfolithobacter dissulfuricans]|nr:ATP synthase F0 subunit B [Desulfolithobacter dissulfuricans]
MTKCVLPVLFALCLSLASVALASSAHEAEPAAAGIHEATVSHAAPEATGATHVAATGHEAAAGHEAVDGHGGGGGHAAPMFTPEKLKDLFWRTVNFIALVIILVKFLAKPIGSGLAGRRQQIKEELEELQTRRDEAERSYKEFEARLAGMEKEMEIVVERAVKQAEAEKEKILADAERQAEDIKRQAEAAIQAEIVKARRELQDEVAEKATAMAEELIVKNLTPEDQVRITEQYLDRVGAVQ